MAAAAAAEDTTREGVRTSVWWDMDSCGVPRGCDPHAVARNIAAALAAAGFGGPIAAIVAYGDPSRLPNHVLHALTSTGVALNVVPAGVKDASDKKILVDMLFWAIDNPPPANYLLISGDPDFSNVLHQLSMRRYNILLAKPPYGSQEMVAAAKCVWSYTSLLEGGPPSGRPSRVGNPLNTDSSNLEEHRNNNTSYPSRASSYPEIHGNGKNDFRYNGRPRSTKYANPSSDFRTSSEEVGDIGNFDSVPSSESQSSSSKWAVHELHRAMKPSSDINTEEGNAKNCQKYIPPPKARQASYRPNARPNENFTSSFSPSEKRYVGRRDVNGVLHKEPPASNVLHALNILRSNKIAPTEENIADCMRYWEMNMPNFDIRKALDQAIQQQEIVVHKLGANISFYIESNGKLWNSVNVFDLTAKHPQKVWDSILEFLSTPDGRSAVLRSQCRYEAAMMLMNSCLRNLFLGDILQILNQTIHVKKWIIPHSFDWQPLFFCLPSTSKPVSSATGGTGQDS